MKKLFLLGLLVSAAFKFNAQNPVTWMATYKTISATEGEIVITAAIENKWHTYSQRATDEGPLPTTITFAPSKQYQSIGKIEEIGAHEEFDNAFGATIFVFNGKAEFRQKVKLIDKAGFTIPFKVDFMCCNDRTCLPPKTIDLSVKTQ